MKVKVMDPSGHFREHALPLHFTGFSIEKQFIFGFHFRCGRQFITTGRTRTYRIGGRCGRRTKEVRQWCTLRRTWGKGLCGEKWGGRRTTAGTVITTITATPIPTTRAGVVAINVFHSLL